MITKKYKLTFYEYEERACTRCHHQKPLWDFNEKTAEDGYTRNCTKCCEARAREKENAKCEHSQRRERCSVCNDNALCKHSQRPDRCRECNGSSFCQHQNRKERCLECGRGCDHSKRKDRCKVCSPLGHLARVVSKRIQKSLKNQKSTKSISYLGISITKYRLYLEGLFEEGMSWDNFGDWQIDHIIPLFYRQNDKYPTLQQIEKRLHYTNTQPLWALDNMSKGNRHIGK